MRLLWCLGALATVLNAETGTCEESAALRSIFRAYQADHRDSAGDWSAVAIRNRERRQRVLEIVGADGLNCPADFHHAATILNRGHAPEHHLLAHVLAAGAAMEPQFKTHVVRRLWANTLDQYLRGVGQPQVFGTVILRRPGEPEFSQEPMDRDLVPEAIRELLGIEDAASQQERLDRLNRGERSVVSVRNVTRSSTPAASACEESRAMRSIAEQDQGDRKKRPIDWKAVNRRDLERRQRIRSMLSAGELACPADLQRAALVFQHGHDKSDYLLAHILASAAAFEGDKAARWLSAAALDRFLGRVGQPQVFGTQYRRPPGRANYSQEPFAREMLSPATRKIFGVADLARQQARLDRMNDRGP